MAVTATNAKSDTGGALELRERRVAAGLSQQALASAADCSLASVALFERGYRPEHSQVLERIERVLNDRSPATNGASEKERDTGPHATG
jgi:transcriptional regulator with XRE-family HTH domain